MSYKEQLPPLIVKDHLGDRSPEKDCFWATDISTTCSEVRIGSRNVRGQKQSFSRL